MSIMSNAKRALAIAAAAATLLSMAACGSSNAASGKSDSSGAASSGKIEVVASINQWGSVAEDLGGSNVEVTNIMTKTNVEAHDYEPTSQDVAKFGTAKVAIVNGADYDPWATKAAQPTKATLVTAAETAGIKEGDTPKGYAQASANESEPTPADIKDFQDTLKAGFIKMFVFNSQEANSTTDQITGAAKDANVPIVELAEQMPKQYTNLLDWMSALVDQFAAAVK